jgi:hypothetical protein
MPPLNLVPLLLLRPLRLFLPSEDARRIRILVLKVTHVPFVALIWIYERSRRFVSHRAPTQLTRAPHSTSRPLSSSPLSLDQRREQTRSSTPHSSALTRTTLKSSDQSANAPTESASTSVENSELIALVQSLALKVDSLSAIIAGQQRD